MDITITGAFGRCGTALIEHLGATDDHSFTLFDRSEPAAGLDYERHEITIGDIYQYPHLLDAMEGQDATVHLAAYPKTDGEWMDVFQPNFVGMYNALEAASEGQIETFVFASSNHVQGMYEVEHAPGIYYPGHGVTLDASDPVRPDSHYAASKAFGEDLLRYYVETHEYPKQGYVLRICSVREPEFDHPFGDAESAAKERGVECGSEDYDRLAARMKAMWQSRRDFAHLVECCLSDDSVEYGIFNGVSANQRRWFSIESARATLGYSPRDDGDTWDEPPSG